MSISSEITRISGNVSAALTAIGAKGVTIPSGANSDDLATLIAAIETGGGDEPVGPTYVNIVPEQTFTPTNDYTLLTFTELLVVGETYRYIVNGVEKTGVAADFYGSIVLGSYADYNSGTGGAFECANNNIYYDTKLRTAQTVQVDRVVEGSGGGSSDSNPLKGKIAAFTGDSLCAGAGYTGGYAGIIGTDYEMTVQNIGTSEGTIVRYQSYFCISESISSLRSDADFVLLEGGGNDAWYGTQVIPLGTLSSGYSATLDTTTFAGAFENMLKSAIARFPNAKIGYIFPHKCIANFDSPNGAYRNMAISALEKWGIPYCDLNVSVPPLGYIDDLKSTYTAGDGIHPNEAGYRTFYVPKIVAFMQTMLTDKTLINKTVTANGTYSASDDSVDGYSSVTVNVSGGASYDGIEIKTSGTTVTEYACHMSSIPDFALNYIDFTKGVNDGLSQITFPVKPTHVGKRAFFQAKARIDWSGLSDMETADEYALASTYISQADWTGDEVTLPSFVGYTSSHNAQNLFRFDGSTAQTYCPKKYSLPVCVVIPQFMLYGIRASNIDVTIGSVGHAVTESKNQPFGSSSNASGAVVIYTTGTYLDSVKTAVQNGLGSNITLTFKASEATTYGGTSYAAGATILTV